MNIAMSGRGVPLRISQVLSILLVLLLAVLRICDGEQQEVESRTLSGSSSQIEVEGRSERSQKVRAKWKGEQFWTSLTANLTQLEHQKAVEKSADADADEMPSQRSGMSFKKSHSSSSKAKKGQPKSKKGSSSRHRHRPRSASKPSSSSPVNSTTTQQPTKTKTTLVPEHKSTIATSTIRSSSERPATQPTSTTSTSTLNSAEDQSESAGQISPAETKSPTSTSGISPPKPTVEPLDRSTLIADLGPYQDFYLEYESNEEDDPLPQAPSKSSTTEMPSTLTTEASANSSQLKITFFPKTPVNLLYLLQAYASNMKPIQLKSPIVNGPSVTIPPTVPLRVPVTVNPPNSPFLFNLDLDNFFTRMAISFFYSSIAIAPMIYLLLNSLGSLAGLSIVPFSGGRRKRRSVPEEIFEGKDIEGLLEQVMSLFDSFMYGDLNESGSKETINQYDSKESSTKEQSSNHQPKDSSSPSSSIFNHNFFEIHKKLLN